MAERKQKVSIPLTVLSVLIAVIVVFPIVWMVLSSFKPSGELFSYPLHLFSQDLPPYPICRTEKQSV